MLVLGYLLAVFLTRDIWGDREGTRVTVAVHTRDGSPLAADAMPQAMRDVQARLDGRGVSGAEIVSDGTNVGATFPDRDLGTDALRDMFGPGEAKTLYMRPVIHAMSVGAQTPPAGAPPLPAPAGGDPGKLIADEKQLRQSTEQNIQLLALQFQATRCDQDDALTGHDDPKLPLVTCSTDGKVVYLLDKSIIGGDQVKNATAGRDTQRDQYVVDLEFDDDAARTWEEFTAANIGTQTAFTLDTEVVSAPEIQETIPGGRTQITGQFDADSARRLAETINRGSSPLFLSFESSTDEMVSATTFSEMLRIVEIVAGVGLAAIVLGAVVYLRRRW